MPGWRTMRQPDGTTLKVRLVGDEFRHFYVDAQGRMLMRDAAGFFAPVEAAQAAELRREGIARRGRRNIPVRRAAEENFSQVPHIGTPRVPIILVQYSDYKFRDADPKATFDSFFMTGQTSVNRYFRDQSNDAFNPQFDVYGPVTLPGKRTDYGGNNRDGSDKGVGEMVAQGCLNLDSRIDFSRYDNDGDGECDVVVVLYAGDGEASSMADDYEDAVWPCQWDLRSSDYGKALTLDNTKVDLFAVFNELNGVDLSKIDGPGTVCHEFSHCLGLPDFYDTQYGPHFGMANWSLMDHGSYNDDGYTPIGYSAYEKEYMGWIEIPEVKENTFYTLTPLNSGSADTDMAVKITNDADTDEYYILECRRQQGWDRFIPAEGMLITHFTYDADAWYRNEVNDYDLQRATIIPADNSLRIDSFDYMGETYYEVNEENMVTDVWPQSYATELTDISTPAAKVNTGGYMSKPITDIVRNADGSVSFWAMKTPLPAVAAPTELSHTQLNDTDVRFDWQCDDPDVEFFTLEVIPYVERLYSLLESVDFTRLHGWTATGYTGVEADGTRLGSSKQQGSLTSGVYKTEDGHDAVTLSFTAKYYGMDASSVKVSVLDGSGKTLDSKTVELDASFADYVVTFPVAGGESFKVRFETVSNKKRLYLKSVDIYSGDASYDLENPSKAPAVRRVEELKRSFSGLKGGSYVVTGLTPGGVYDCRIKSIPADRESYEESAWTPMHRLEMSVMSGILTLPSSESGEVWYTLQGIRLCGAPTQAGVYVRVRGGKAERILRGERNAE